MFLMNLRKMQLSMFGLTKGLLQDIFNSEIRRSIDHYNAHSIIDRRWVCFFFQTKPAGVVGCTCVRAVGKFSNRNKAGRARTRVLCREQIADAFRNFLTPAYLNIVFAVSSASAPRVQFT